MTVQGSVSKGWLHEACGFSFQEKYYFDPLFRLEQDRAIGEYLEERFPEYPLYNMESNLVQAEYSVPDMAYVGGIQPNLILGVLLGAEFVFPEGGDADISDAPWKALRSAEDLPEIESLLAHPLIERFSRQIRQLRGGRPELRVIPPFFWDLSGRATIHGFVTTAFKLLGDSLFILMFEAPEFIREVHAWIHRAYTELIRTFSELASIPAAGVHIGECSGALISAEDFRTYVLPYASEMGNIFGSIRFHSCGLSDHLLGSIAEISGLASLDTGSDTSITGIRETMGKEFLIEIAPPVEILVTGASAKDIRDWLAKVLAENAGGPLKIGYHLEPGYRLDNVLEIHRELNSRGLTKPGRKFLYR